MKQSYKICHCEERAKRSHLAVLSLRAKRSNLVNFVIASEAKQSLLKVDTLVTKLHKSKYKSLKSGFRFLISSIFFFLEPALICFSRFKANSISS